MQLLHSLLEWAKRHPRLAQFGVWSLLTVFLGWLFRELTKTIFFDWLKDLLFRWLGDHLGIADVNSLAYIIISILIPAGLSAALVWLPIRHGMSLAGGAEELSAPSAPKAEQAAPADHPANIDARSALLYAANGTWAPPSRGNINADTARELQRVFDALERFYESASHAKGLRVWGRTSPSRPLKSVERLHWQEWHIRHSDIFGTEPLRTVPRDRLPSKSAPYYDLHLNKTEVEEVWPHKRLLVQEAALICFEETGLYADSTMSAELRLYQFIVLMVMEANENPTLLSIWGRQVPSRIVTRLPQSRLQVKFLRSNGTQIGGGEYLDAAADWVDLSIPSAELPPFIERLKKKETAGQQLAR